jgi:magnesium chelatase accessory protein
MSRRGRNAAVVLINPALSGFEGLAGWLFPALARGLVRAPFTADLFSTMAGRKGTVRRLLRATGSQITPDMEQRYLHLLQDRDHVAATLAMMAAWDLKPLLRALPAVKASALVLVGERDRTIPPEVGRKAADRLPQARLIVLPDLGPLAQEEAPQTVATPLRAFLARSRQT